MLAAVAADPPDLILLDTHMKGVGGLELCRRLKASEETRQIPIILLSAFADWKDCMSGLQMGAADYIPKPFRAEALLSRVMTHLSLRRANAALEHHASAVGRANDRLQAELFERERVADQLRQSLERGERSRRALLSALEDQKLTEGTLRLQGAALNAAANAMIITGLDGTIAWINAAFTSLTGYREEEAVGRKTQELVKSGVHDEAFYKHLWETILGGNVWQGEMTNRRKDGSLYREEQTITPVKDDRGEVAHFIAIKRDLTEQDGLKAQFLQAQKMETVGQLAGGIAHDFNNLLTIINGTAELAAADLPQGDPFRTDFEDIRRAGDRAAGLTRQLLAYSRTQVMKPIVLNLSTLVVNMGGMLQRLIGENIELVVRPADPVGSVIADPAQIEQVVMNLAVNARDAMPRGGSLTIETRDVALDAAFAATHPSVQPGPHVMLAISDTGAGMEERTRLRIFEPFFTTKERGRGTGLGLSTVYGIVKQSGGSIWVHTELGRGTAFEIYLPRVEAAVHLVQPAPTVTSGHGTETILIAEDEENVRHLADRALRQAGYTVLTAGSGAEALAILERHEGPVHLLLTDMIMPGMSGRDLGAWTAAVNPRMKVLYTSGHTDEAILRGVLSDQDTHFIPKPYAAAELTRKVREVLDSSDHG